MRALLSAYFGDVAYRELSQLAKIAATRSNSRGKVVFVLPGIMGSRLGSAQRRTSSLLWLHPVAIAQGGLSQLALPGPKSLRALGVMLPGYLKLRLTLEIAGFRPVFHPFDWRADLETLARALLRSIEKSGARKVSIVAHSMGGLVARIALAKGSRPAHPKAGAAWSAERGVVCTGASAACRVSHRAEDCIARSSQHCRGIGAHRVPHVARLVSNVAVGAGSR